MAALGKGSTDAVLYALQESGKPLSNKELSVITGYTVSQVGKILYTQRNTKAGATVKEVIGDDEITRHEYIGDRKIDPPAKQASATPAKTTAPKAKRTPAKKTTEKPKPAEKRKTKKDQVEYTTEEFGLVVAEFGKKIPLNMTNLVMNTKLLEPVIQVVVDELAADNYLEGKSILGETVYVAKKDVSKATPKQAVSKTEEPVMDKELLEDLLFLLADTPATLEGLVVVFDGSRTKEELDGAIKHLLESGQIQASSDDEPKYSKAEPAAKKPKAEEKPKRPRSRRKPAAAAKTEKPAKEKPATPAAEPAAPPAAEPAAPVVHISAAPAVSSDIGIAELLRKSADYIEKLEQEKAELVQMLTGLQDQIKKFVPVD